MTNLRNTPNLSRALTWNGRSLATCSRKELIDCIIDLARQVTIASDKIGLAENTINELTEKLQSVSSEASSESS